MGLVWRPTRLTACSHRPSRITAIAFPPRSPAKPSGCITCSASACEMLSCCWLNVASLSLMSPFVSGARSSARHSRAVCDAADHGRETSGTWTGVHQDRGRAALTLACRGSGRHCARHPGSATAGCQSSKAILQTVAERPSICAARDRDR